MWRWWLIVLLFLFSINSFAIPSTKTQVVTKIAPRIVPKNTAPAKVPLPTDIPDSGIPIQFNNNNLYRSYDDNQDVTYVDPFSGRVNLHIPLIHIPGNNGLDLKVNLNWRGDERPYNNPTTMTISDRENPSIFTGISPLWRVNYMSPDSTETITDDFPAFIDPDGKVHILYPQSSNWTQLDLLTTFQTKDQWVANLALKNVSNTQCSNPYPNRAFAGTVIAPNGVQYQVEPRCGISPVAKITSPQGGSVLTYTNNDTGQVTSITTSQGFSVSFTYNSGPYPANQDLATMTTSDGRTWTLTYGTPRDSLKKITLPNGENWAINFDDNYYNDRFELLNIVSPKGLAIAYTYDNQHGVRYDADRLAAYYVTSKTVTGPGITAATWNYTYEPSSCTDNNNCQYGSHTTVSGPDKKIIYSYNAENDLLQLPNGMHTYFQILPTPMTGLLLTKAIYDPTGTTLYEQDDYVWGQRQISSVGMYNAPSWCVPAGSVIGGPYQPSTGMFAPQLSSKTITRSGTSYKTTYSNYDSYGYPGKIAEVSPQASLERDITYYENPTLWIFAPKTETLYADGAVADTVVRVFNSKGNMLTENRNGVITTYTYDEVGNVISQIDAAGNTTTYSDYRSGLPQKTVDALGHASSMVIATNGTITSKTDKIGYLTSYTYDPLYRVISITPPLHAPITIAWNDSPSGSSATIMRGQHKIVNEYTGYGDLLSTSDSGGNYIRNIFRSYDPDRRLTFVSYPTASSMPGAGVVTTYDPLDRTTTITEAGKYAITMRYNDINNSMSATDPNGNVTTTQYRSYGDPNDRQLMAIQQQMDSSTPINTTFRRNVFGQIMMITQGKLIREYSYDTHHYLIAEYNPETGITTYGHDILGNVVSKIIGKSLPINYHYDALNHLIMVNYKNANGGNEVLTNLYDAENRLLATGDTHSNSTWYYYYDGNGNNISAQLSYTPAGQPKNDIYKNFTYSYDNLDHLSSMTYPTGTKLTYNIDPMGNVLTIAPYVSNITYFPDGKVQSFTDANNVTTNYTENDRNMIDSFIITQQRVQLENRKYIYDGDNNILSIQDLLNSANNQSFSYNNVNWLTKAVGPWGRSSVTYDINGNILSKNTDAEKLTYAYDNATNLLTAITGTVNYRFGYDYAGDTTLMGNNTYSYNTLQRLTQTKGSSASGAFTVDYSYDGNGNRVFMNKTGTHASGLVLEAYGRNSQILYKENAAQNELYIYLGDHTIAHSVIKAGVTATTYLHNNLLGSPLTATNDSGTPLWQQEYKPYGAELKDNTAQDITHIGYTGKPHDKDTGLSYYGARYYNPQIGRFMSLDPHSVVGDMPITFNRYVYAANNPYKYKDPNGEFIEIAIGIGMGALAGGLNGGWTGAIAGAIIGGIVGTVDPLASEAAGAYVGGATGSLVASLMARVGTSIAVNTAGNVAQSEYTNGSANWGQSFSGALGGAAFSNMAALGMGAFGNYAGNRVGNALATSGMAQTGSNVGASIYSSAVGFSDTSTHGNDCKVEHNVMQYNGQMYKVTTCPYKTDENANVLLDAQASPESNGDNGDDGGGTGAGEGDDDGGGDGGDDD